jgi:hypothetical protein
MKLGTKSILFGVHCVFIHPFFVALAWWKLYGFPWNPILWAAFFLHDIGYWGKPNLDGPEGETHPETGARIMQKCFGTKWGEFTLLHSRHYAKILQKPYSRLCPADKLATAITPDWLYLILANLTGEIHEFMQEEPGIILNRQQAGSKAVQKAWLRDLKKLFRSWAFEYREPKEDTWTRKDRSITKALAHIEEIKNGSGKNPEPPQTIS